MNYKVAFFFTLSVLVLLVSYLIGKRIYYAPPHPVPYTYSADAYMRNTAALQNSLPIDTTDIVFIGNSLTSNFPIYEMFGNPHIKNRGVGSNKLIDMVNRVEPIAAQRPKKIFIEGGINDLLYGAPVENALGTYQLLIEFIRSKSPGTKLYIQSTLPTSGESIVVMPAIDSLNNQLKKFCSEENITFVDLHPALRKGQGLDTSLTWDGIHLNIKGYRKWQTIVEGYF